MKKLKPIHVAALALARDAAMFSIVMALPPLRASRAGLLGISGFLGVLLLWYTSYRLGLHEGRRQVEPQD